MTTVIEAAGAATDSALTNLLAVLLVLAIPSVLLLACRVLNRRWDRAAQDVPVRSLLPRGPE